MTFNLEVLRKRFGEIEQNLRLLEQASQLPLTISRQVDPG